MLYVNGKFAAQRTTGVQRVAGCLVQAIDEHPAGARCVLLCPAGSRPLPLRRIEQRWVGGADLPLHAWEQHTLPRAARAGLLLNLSGSAPAFASRQAALLHDAAVFDQPSAYTLAFGIWYRWLFSRLARRAEALFTVSAFSQQRLAQHLSLPQERLTVVANGAEHLQRVLADATALDRLGLRGARFLLAVGSDNPTKNLALLQAAFARIGEPGLRLVIVGGDNERVFAGRGAGLVGAIAEGVQRTGPLDDASLRALYQHALALVFPSIYEGFGLPPLEAMAEGCPVAASRAAAVPEVCGAAATYFDPTSVDDLVFVLRAIVTDVSLRARLAAAGRVRAAQFRWADGAARLLEAVVA